MARKKQDKTQLEKLYEKYFLPEGGVLAPDEGSLEQPSPLVVVESVTTYGAYEDPLVGA